MNIVAPAPKFKISGGKNSEIQGHMFQQNPMLKKYNFDQAG